MKDQGLLKTLDQCEYPAEFLAARLLGKKGALFRNWEFLISGSDTVELLQNTPFYSFLKSAGAPGIWHFLSAEHLWVHKRMSHKLRIHFEPYFVYHEIRPLMVCLRNLSSRSDNGNALQVLQKSLLHQDIQDILTNKLDFHRLLQALESRLCSCSVLFTGLRECFEKKGMAALEVFIRNCFFASFLSRKPTPMLKSFLQYLIDYHNCLTLAKALRWQLHTEPAFINGGTVPIHRLTDAYFSGDMIPVLKLLRLRAVNVCVSSLQKLETALLSFITSKLKAWSLQRSVEGDILFYLWEQYRYARNISMVLNTILLDDEPVRESIVA